MSAIPSLHDSVNFFSVGDLPVTPWRNGGGETREIICTPSGADNFNWRASIATIAQDGPFSAFPGIDRSITLLTGEGVHLFAAKQVDQLLVTPAQPFAFSGDIALMSRLTGGVTTDFNIMTRRGVCRSVVTAHTDEFCAPLLMGGVLLVLKGEWLLQGERKLSANDGVVWPYAADATLELALSPTVPESLLLWAAILPH